MPEKSTALYAAYAMDDERKSVTPDGEEVTPTPTEYDISLVLLLENPGKRFFERRYLPARLEGRTVFRGGNGAGAYPPSA